MNFEQESMKGMRVGTQTAVRALFWQFDGDFGFVEVLEVLESCASLCLMFRICLITLLRLACAEMKVLSCYALFLTL